MATGYSSILPQPSHGERDGDAGCSMHSPPGPRTLRRRVESHVSPQHANHDTEGGGHSRSPSSVHQNGGDQGGEEADVDSERDRQPSCGVLTLQEHAAIALLTDSCRL